MNIKSKLNDITTNNVTMAVLGSHSALDVCLGAKREGFRTLVITEKGRNRTYDTYYKTSGTRGCVDETIQLDKFKDILKSGTIEKLIERNAIFIPHRSFEVYLNDYDAIENTFDVPMFGNRKLLRIEERGIDAKDQYFLMKKAGIRHPKIFKSPKDIDRLVLVKILEAERGFERANFLANSYEEYEEKMTKRLEKKEILKEQVGKAVIEEFVLGVQVNFNFFYSPLTDRLELLGTDTRRQTNHEGMAKLTPEYQKQFQKLNGRIKYEEAGHIATTVLESMLEQVFALGEQFVKITRELVAPGVIGPFALQSMITPGPPKKDIVVFDISPRMPGSPGISATPYSTYLFGKPIPVGRRVAMEIKDALRENCLDKIVT